ncbi:hypothetical protein CLPU_3c03040 [Gottschalkia purinilytica]|uniref:Uncharacterized protein n=1 Tax=Gottschalkia purinilytica TaxID=1503 RepID=A0A0L0WDG9_GOTPU|nr:hypothetical protein [Gottschalkia purinilytica]KNF09524.1 hypothetical protein CLPU_3c03040 [Gottschalkia purinilytica]
MSTENIESVDTQKKKYLLEPIGSPIGFGVIILIGVLIYFILTNIQNITYWLPYEEIAKNSGNNLFYKIIWMVKDFSEPQFYGGLFAGLGVILGGIVAWILDVKKSKFAGFNISYGLNVWPWVFASQILSLLLAVFAFKYITLLDKGHNWIPTFLVLVGAPQAVMIIYGPSKRALITGSILGGLITPPIALWLSDGIVTILRLPLAISNYIALATAITITLQVCKIAPWMKKSDFNVDEEDAEEVSRKIEYEQLKSPIWFIRRVLADFTDPLFYGNEIATIFLIIGAIIDWFLNTKHGLLGTGVFPGILLSQLIGGGIGVLLYGRKHIEYGWYPTYIPVVSVGPICVLTFGATLPVIIFSSVFGGIIGPPFAELLNRNIPDHLHGVIPNMVAMALTSIMALLVMNYLPWF